MEAAEHNGSSVCSQKFDKSVCGHKTQLKIHANVCAISDAVSLSILLVDASFYAWDGFDGLIMGNNLRSSCRNAYI